MKVDWEPLNQIRASELPEPSSEHPIPWSIQSRGNGHIDVYDGNGKYFAHVFCWDKNDFNTLDAKIAKASS